MHIDEGIDTGDIAINKKIKVSSKDNIFSLKKKVLITSGEAILELLKKAKKTKLPRKKQESKHAKTYNTPTFSDIMRNFKKIF
ncbi:hypothetical protein JKY72_05800 [Candidatus Gracilibacteria bacterium]|nr:hypothetical protein [Candidatus Gracilibacteria bacterium]